MLHLLATPKMALILAGGAPVGALAMGYVTALTGPRHAAIYPAAAMLVVLAFLVRRSALWRHTAGPGRVAGRRP